MDSLNGVQYLLCLKYRVKSLNMKNNAFAGTRIGQETGEPDGFSQRKLEGLFSQRSKGNGPDRQLDLSVHTGFENFRLVFKDEVDGGDSDGRVAQRT